MPVSSSINSSTLLTEAEQTELRALAFQVISNGAQQHKLILPSQPKSKALQQATANFVTVYVDDELRGCLGCYIGEQPLWKSVCHHAYSSAFEDYRFTPLQAKELAVLRIEISILSELMELENNGQQALLASLVPEVDGLLIKEQTAYGAKRSALFLPSVWRSLPTAEMFVQTLKQKGGWPSDYWSEYIELFRFHTQVF